MHPIELVPILLAGVVADPAPDLAAVPPTVLAQTAALYAARGYEPPWIGYLGVERGRAVGTCAFASPPWNGRVEIAYFTFAGHERRGVATRMAAALIARARAADPGIVLIAHTLPRAGASTAILARLGFAFSGLRDHPDDGAVWAWRLAAPAGAG